MSLHVDAPQVRRKDAGRMTAAMRAATAPTVAKVLRVAVVQRGRVIEERVFREPRGGFVDDDKLFERVGGTYWLSVPTGAIGRVLTKEGAIEVGPLASRVRLDDSARGRIALGASTVLFQFVAPPPHPARAQLPLVTKRAEIDWTLTVIVALSFLVHFGFIGCMFSDWLDPVVTGDDEAIVRLIDMTPATPLAVVEDPASTTPSTVAAPTTTTTTPSTQHPTSSTHADANARAASIARDAEDMKINLLVAFGGASAVEGALNRSDFPLPDLDVVARDPRGADHVGGELKLTTGAGHVPGSTDLRHLGDGRSDETHGGHEREPLGPMGDATPIIDITIKAIPGLEAAVMRLRPSWRSCYVRKGLSLDPTMEGRMTIDFHIGPNGDVLNVTRVDGIGLSPAVEECIIERAHNASVGAPGGTGAHGRVPIVFRNQK